MELNRLSTTRVGGTTLEQMLRRPEVVYADLPPSEEALSVEVKQQVEIQIKYSGYIDRQEIDVEKFRSMEDKPIPQWLDYQQVPSLRKEARQKLETIRPATLGQAGRISGVSPADLSLVMVWIKRGPGAAKLAAAEEEPEGCDLGN